MAFIATGIGVMLLAGGSYFLGLSQEAIGWLGVIGLVITWLGLRRDDSYELPNGR